MKYFVLILFLLFFGMAAGQSTGWWKSAKPADSLDFKNGVTSARLYWHFRMENSVRRTGTAVDSIIDLARGRFVVPVSTAAQYDSAALNDRPGVIFTNDPYVDNAGDTRSAYDSLHNGLDWMLIAVLKWTDAADENSALFGNFNNDDQGGRGSTLYFIDSGAGIDSQLYAGIGNTGPNFLACRQLTNAGQFPAGSSPQDFTYVKLKHEGTGTANFTFYTDHQVMADTPSDQDGTYNTGTSAMDMHFTRRGTDAVFMDGGVVVEFAIWIEIPDAADEAAIDAEINRLYGK